MQGGLKWPHGRGGVIYQNNVQPFDTHILRYNDVNSCSKSTSHAILVDRLSVGEENLIAPVGTIPVGNPLAGVIL